MLLLFQRFGIVPLKTVFITVVQEPKRLTDKNFLISYFLFHKLI